MQQGWFVYLKDCAPRWLERLLVWSPWCIVPIVWNKAEVSANPALRNKVLKRKNRIFCMKLLPIFCFFGLSGLLEYFGMKCVPWRSLGICPGWHRHEFSVQAEGLWSLEFAQWHGCLEWKCQGGKPGCRKSVISPQKKPTWQWKIIMFLI